MLAIADQTAGPNWLKFVEGSQGGYIVVLSSSKFRIFFSVYGFHRQRRALQLVKIM